MRILVAYDGSLLADAAIEDLRRAGVPKQAEVLVVCVADGCFTRSEAEALAEKAGERIGALFPQWTVSLEALWGPPAKVILDTANRWHPDLLVIGSHGRSGVARLFLGSVSLELIHKAPCSVRITRMGGSQKPDCPIHIIIGNDGSAEAEKVICSVAGRSWPENTEVQIVSAVQTLVPVTTEVEASTYSQEPAYKVILEADEQMRFRLGNIAAESANLLHRSGLIASTHLVEADPRDAILDTAELEKADTIFVGARGRGRMERLLLGSVSSYVVTHAHCSVEVVRGNHFQ
jgi:nucleotide-binding universal stress UspA family protein